MSVIPASGDLFLSKAQTLAHGVNCSGRMGAGIAAEFKKRFPEMFAEYRRRCRGGELQPGGAYLEKKTTPWVLNLATQATTSGARPEFVRSCFDWIASNYRAEGITSIAMPRIAAGLGGLDRAEVERTIREILNPLPIRVTVYTEYIAGQA